MAIKKTLLTSILFLSLTTSCTTQQLSQTPETNFNITSSAQEKTTHSISNNEEDSLYQAYLKAKQNVKPMKTFPGTSEEFGPKPTEGKASVPDSTPFLDLRKNTRLKQEVMGDKPFPTRSGKATPKSNSDFSIKTCCGSSALHWGARISHISSPVNNQWGVYGGHKVNPNLTLPNYELLYSPVTMPPNNSTLEAAVVYDRWFLGTGGSIKRFAGVWNHRLGGEFKHPKQFDDSVFMSTYVGNFTDGQFYFFRILKTSSSDEVYSIEYYNFQTSLWENQYSYDPSNPATPPGPNDTSQSVGWSFHEPKWDDICLSLPAIKASNVQVWNGSSWYHNTAANGGTFYSGGYTCPNWSYNWIDQYYHWQTN